jgi:hypothetical protein
MTLALGERYEEATVHRGRRDPTRNAHRGVPFDKRRNLPLLHQPAR